MLTNDDKQIIEEIIDRRIDRVEIKIDRVLKIVTRTDQEHTLTKAKVNKLEKRMKKVETKLKIKSPNTSSAFA